MFRIRLVAPLLALAVAGATSPPAHAAVTAEGFWTAGSSLSTCMMTSLYGATCYHSAGMLPFQGVPPMCVETIAGTNVALTDCSVRLTGSSSTKAVTNGIKVSTLCVTVGTNGSGVVEIISNTGTYSVPVAIINSQGGASVFGTKSLEVGRITVGGYFTGGCGGAGYWTGAYEITT